ncbi:MAG: amidohydrolase family protein [Rhodospirillales bacterium]|jgi:predicted TIM-barrel fold metal-dependent hydrolase|nr:amidohydrolase family protein [Rhodospirillales bacterium]MBT5076473.1 amidohydrolase family protein [Rhodospirillales bacterium]MBT5112633.1 amidohydrolase family protein [Rhodospirillales bacterium]MBT5673402.1 amidohydrolase family protein [Rhodospirillales bacterium]MBT6186061.1 amidohydrolase family protein [Rhodospirillales bacterium]
MTVIDADAHVIENEATWQYLSEADRQYQPMVLQQVDGVFGHTNRGAVSKEWWMVGTHVQPADRNINVEDLDPESRNLTNVKSRLDHMDQLGIDVQVLYPTIFLSPCSPDAAGEFALYHSYNQWLADIWKQAPDRLPWAAMAPLNSLHKLREELEFAKANGAVSIFVRPFECERGMFETYFDPLYEAAQDLDLAVTFHAGNGSFQNHKFLEPHNFAKFKLSMIAAFHGLLEFEVPKRFPGVRWGLIEASASWVPYALIDAEKRLKRKGKRLSSDPLKDNNIFVTIEMTDDIPYIIDRVGDDNLVVGTDYGHTDTSAEIEALRMLRDNGKVNETSINKILGPNSEVLYGL